MCGIIGYCSTVKIKESDLLKEISHRGPDSQGFFSCEIADQFIGMGHTRLSILDLTENGNQPMIDDEKKVVLIFNGEIYNFKDLKNRHLKNESFHSQTDTEVLLKLYLKFGLKFINELNGDFAFSILDKRINKLFLIRDRMGVKPLYYYQSEQLFTFSSEIKPLFKAGVPKKINLQEIQNYFIFKYSPQENTLIEKVNRLKPGSILTFDIANKTITISTYWELKKEDSYKKINYLEAKNEVEKLIENSIQIRLMSDVPIGNFLSGGIDSSIIAYYLKDYSNITHYCAVKNEKDLQKEGSTSDGKYAQLLAQKWNLDLKKIPIGSNETNERNIKKTLWYSDDLIADGSQIPSYLIAQKASESSKVLLSGMGADELFFGYAGHQISYLATKIDKTPSWMKNYMYSWMKNLNQGKGKLLSYRRFLHKLGKNAPLENAKYGNLNIVGDVESALSIFSIQGNYRSILDSYFVQNNDLFDNIMHFEFENFLQKNLHYLDRMTMANGVEARVPFLDHRLVELAYNLPLKFKISPLGKTKKILKDIYKEKLPNEIIQRRKAGFGMPLRSIFSDKNQIYKLLNLDFFDSFDGFEIDNIIKTIDLHTSGKEDQSALIYALISFQYWCETHIYEH
jgi:asparagine synthase (glutamine-hydrolysing)